MATKLYLRYPNRSSILAKKKYIDRSPNIAMIFELNTKNGSEVMANIAGILSRANKMSVNSISISAKNKGVAIRRPRFLMKKSWLFITVVIGISLRTDL